jgi:hypothetical protein
MAQETYDIGDRVRLFADFKNDAAVATNTTVLLTTRDPNGLVTTRATTNPSAGRYESEFNLSGADAIAGRWYFRFEGTVTVVAAEEGTFYVRQKETA